MNRCILTNASFIHSCFWKNESLRSNVHIPCSLITSTSMNISQQLCSSSRIQTVPEWAVTEENNSDG